MTQPRQLAIPALIGSVLALATALPGQVDWVQIPIPPAQSPPPRNSGKLVPAGRCGCLILYGGWSNTQNLTDMWRFDGVTWSLIDSNAPPGMRWGHGMSHDLRTGELLLFGGARGFYINDTWKWDGTTWTELRPVHSPPPRASVELVYDEARGVHVLFGGDDFGGSHDETWEWDGQDWTHRAFTIRPAARREFEMVYDRGRQVTVLFGGQQQHGTLFGDTWEYDGIAWTQRFPTNSPAPRSTHAMVYDEARGRVVLYGGYHDPWTANSSPLPETWEWDGIDWVQRSTSAGPATPFQQSIGYAPGSGLTVAFSGATTTETWFLFNRHPATASRMSSGCASASTGVTPSLDPASTLGNLPWIGDTFTLEMSDVPPGGRPIAMLGTTDRSWAGRPLPLSLTLFGGGPGCTLDIAPAATPAMTPGPGNTARFDLPIPNVRALVGLNLYGQGAVLEPAGSSSVLTTTNALLLQIGSR